MRNGEQGREAMQREPLTITYHQGRWSSWSSVNRSLRDAGQEVAYALGLQAPHYPVPALYQHTLEQPHAMTDCTDPVYVAWFNSL